MNDEMLDILIGKYLDSEMTPAEKRLLDQALSDDDQARALLAEMTRLRDLSITALDGVIAGTGQDMDDVFDAAEARVDSQSVHTGGSGSTGRGRVIRLSRVGRPLVHLAAGFALALVAMGVMRGLLGEPTASPESVTRDGQVARVESGIGSTSSDSAASAQAETVAEPMGGAMMARADNDNDGPEPERPKLYELRNRSGGMDWYHYQDGNGRRWLVESPRTSGKPIEMAGYHSDL